MIAGIAEAVFERRPARPLLFEAVAVAGATAAAVVVYMVVHGTVLDLPNYIDPWIYTALFVNFDFVFHWFHSTYYASRLAWVVPGRIAHALLPPVPAFFLLHVTFFFAGAGALYATLRSFFGRRIALLGYLALIGNLSFYLAHANDYPDGAVIGYLLLALVFALTSVTGSRSRLRMGLAGFFLAAGVTTNLWAVVPAVGMGLVYAALVLPRPRPRPLEEVLRDWPFLCLGAVALLAALGIVSRVAGGEFFFFMPSVRATQVINNADYSPGSWSWMMREPRVYVPFFLIIVGLVTVVPLLRGRWRSTRGGRLAVGAFAYLVYFTAASLLWDTVFHGNTLLTYYYFSLFLTVTVLCVAAVAHVVGERTPLGMGASAVGLVAFVPTLAIYGGAGTAWLTGRRGGWITVALMVAAVLAVVLAVRIRRSATGVAALGAIVLATCFATAASSTTWVTFRTSPASRAATRDTLSLTLQLIRFLRSNGLQQTVPAFWFDAREGDELTGMQSAYLYETTQLGTQMPRLDASTRTRLDALAPHVLVLLCARRACENAPAQLEKGGFRPALRAEKRLTAGDETVWARAFALRKFALPTRIARDPQSAFYYPQQTALVPLGTGVPVARWSFAGRSPQGWSTVGDVHTTARRDGLGIETTGGRFDYQLSGPKVELEPGSYAVYVSGRVVAGGMLVGVLDSGSDSWIAQHGFWFRQSGFGAKWMSVPFKVDSAGAVQVILSNWRPADGSSEWTVRDLRIVRRS